MLVYVDAGKWATFARCHSVTTPYRVCDTCDTKPISSKPYLPSLPLNLARVLDQAALAQPGNLILDYAPRHLARLGYVRRVGGAVFEGEQHPVSSVQRALLGELSGVQLLGIHGDFFIGERQTHAERFGLWPKVVLRLPGLEVQ
jgi:hypothetical protein